MWQKNAEKDDFNQQTECEAPICWSKYTMLRSLGQQAGVLPIEQPLLVNARIFIWEKYAHSLTNILVLANCFGI